MALLPSEEVEQALADDLSGWQVSGGSGGAITRDVRADSFLAGIDLLRKVAEVAEAMNHHPDVDIRYTTLTFTLSTHSAGGITAKDLELAARIDRLVSP